VTRPRVLLADDHRIVAEGLKALLSPELDLLGIVEDGEALVAAARSLRPDVIVADIGMPRLNGFEALARIKQDDPSARVVFLTMHRERAYVRRALEAGASGFVLKHSAPTELMTAIRAALAGDTYITPTLAGDVLPHAQSRVQAGNQHSGDLTPRQQEILRLLVDGLSAKEIGRRLAISPRTVEFHKQQMMGRLKLNSATQLLRWAIQQGVVSI
jgi:DNA-binding NarL/FixJ family response regulator